MIMAADPSGVIGVDNKIPWHYPADLKRFRALTMGGVLIMGRKTFDSIGRRHLPGRESLVVSSEPQPEVCSYANVEGAIEAGLGLQKPVWIIGGAQVYREALTKGLVDFAEITVVPPVHVPQDAKEVAVLPWVLLSYLTLVHTIGESPLEYRRYDIR